MYQYMNHLEVLVMKYCSWFCKIDTIPLHTFISFHIINNIITTDVLAHFSTLLASIILLSAAYAILFY